MYTLRGTLSLCDGTVTTTSGGTDTVGTGLLRVTEWTTTDITAYLRKSFLNPVSESIVYGERSSGNGGLRRHCSHGPLEVRQNRTGIDPRQVISQSTGEEGGGVRGRVRGVPLAVQCSKVETTAVTDREIPVQVLNTVIVELGSPSGT